MYAIVLPSFNTPYGSVAHKNYGDALDQIPDNAMIKQLLTTSISELTDALGTAAYKNEGHGSGLHADLLDGKHASDFAARLHGHTILDIMGLLESLNSKLNRSEYTAANILQLLLAVHGHGSNLDADKLDGEHGSYYRNASNLNVGTVPADRLNGTYGISITGNAASANKLTNGRQIKLSGEASGTTTFTGESDVDIQVTLSDTKIQQVISGAMGTSTSSNSERLGNQLPAFYRNASNLNTGTVPADRLNGTYGISITGNAASANKLTTARNIALSGAVSGNANFDGSSNITINTTLGAHTHDMSNISGLAEAIAAAGSSDGLKEIYWYTNAGEHSVTCRYEIHPRAGLPPGTSGRFVLEWGTIRATARTGRRTYTRNFTPLSIVTYLTHHWSTIWSNKGAPRVTHQDANYFDWYWGDAPENYTNNHINYVTIVVEII
jgi:hypothetical protein